METAVKTGAKPLPLYVIEFMPNWERFRNLMFSTSQDYIPVTVSIPAGDSARYEFIITVVEAVECADRDHQSWRVKGLGTFMRDPRTPHISCDFTLTFSIKYGHGTLITRDTP